MVEEKDIVDVELLDAIVAGDIEKLHSLLQRFKKSADHSIAAKNETEAHPLLHWAALESQIPVMNYLISQLGELPAQFDIDARNPRGETALHWACLRGHVRAVHLLLEHGAKIFAVDDRGYSALVTKNCT